MADIVATKVKMLDSEEIEVNEETELDNEETELDANIIPIRAVKLLKLRHNIEKLRKDILSNYLDELKDCKKVCETAKSIIGELNDDIKEDRE